MSEAVPSLKNGNWQTDFPAEAGDWVFIRQWACGCCLIESGIAWVQEWDGTAAEWEECGREHPDLYRYTTPDARMWNLSWGKDPERVFEDGKLEIHWWQKVTLPPYPDELLDEVEVETDA